jgi:hypothetical protein
MKSLTYLTLLSLLLTASIGQASTQCDKMAVKAAVSLDAVQEGIDRTNKKSIKSSLWKSDQNYETWIVELAPNKVKSENWYTIEILKNDGLCEIDRIEINRHKDDID